MGIDLEALRKLDPAGQDAALRAWLEADEPMREEITEAVDHWHVPFRKRILAEFQREVPGITAADVDLLVASFRRLYRNGK